MKKMAMVLVCVMVLSVVAIGNEATAAPPAFPDWYNCTVLSTGALPLAPFNFYFVFVTNNDGWWTGARAFLMDASNAATKTAFAEALTGYASGGQVSLYIPGYSSSNPPPDNTFVQGVNAGTL